MLQNPHTASVEVESVENRSQGYIAVQDFNKYFSNVSDIIYQLTNFL